MISKKRKGDFNVAKKKKRKSNKKTSVAKVNIQELQESRDGGQIALKGYSYQFLYSCNLILSADANTTFTLEGIEDIDSVKYSDDSKIITHIQLKYSTQRQDASFMDSVLKNYLEAYLIDKNRYFKLVYDFSVATGNLSKLFLGNLDKNSKEFWKTKINAIKKETLLWNWNDFDFEDFIKRLSFENVKKDFLEKSIEDLLIKNFEINTDSISLFANSIKLLCFDKMENRGEISYREITQCIENVKFDYQLGDAPQATAWVAIDDMDKYEIDYGCWQQFKGNEPVAAWYSDNGSHGSLPTITEFESGKRYVYSLMLKPKDGYSFNSETTVTVNGESVKSSLSGEYLYVPAVKTITMPTLTVIDVVEINGATVSFQDGDRPVFTGDVPDDVYYVLRAAWWELNSTTGLISTEPEFGSGIYENKITTFEAGKTYHYGVYVVAYGDVGNVRYIFGPDTKLKINGEFVNYKRYEGDMSDGSDGTMWVLTDLTMTPGAGGTAPSEKYTVTYTDGVDNEEIFKDQTYTVEAGKATPAFNGTPTRKGYTFVGWKPAVAATVTGNATYEATWKSDSATTTPSDNKPSTGETTSPKTGDTSNIVLWAALLFVSCGALAGTLVIDKKKKTMK